MLKPVFFGQVEVFFMRPFIEKKAGGTNRGERTGSDSGQTQLSDVDYISAGDVDYFSGQL